MAIYLYFYLPSCSRSTAADSRRFTRIESLNNTTIVTVVLILFILTLALVLVVYGRCWLLPCGFRFGPFPEREALSPLTWACFVSGRVLLRVELGELHTYYSDFIELKKWWCLKHVSYLVLVSALLL
jgi:hypothetical protein